MLTSVQEHVNFRAGGHVPNLCAYMGRDELSDPGEVGLKQQQLPCGLTPLVVIESHRAKIIGAHVIDPLQEVVNQYGKPVVCIEYAPVRVLFVIEPG